MTDPPVFASMFFGAPWATGILRAALIEAGAAGGGELLAQIGIQTSRTAFGEEPDIEEAATAVGVAAAGAGAEGGGGCRAKEVACVTCHLGSARSLPTLD